MSSKIKKGGLKIQGRGREKERGKIVVSEDSAPEYCHNVVVFFVCFFWLMGT